MTKKKHTVRSQKLTILEAESWETLRTRVDEARRILAPEIGEEIWYRGVSKREYRLLPSLQRAFRQNASRESIRELETDLFFEFLSKARTGEGAGLDHWDVLFLMQHYRAPTRLLDWTEVLHVALYFAVANTKSGDASTPRLYLMNPYAWNEGHIGERDLYWPRYFGYDEAEEYFYEYGEILVDGGVDWEYPVSLHPPQRGARLSAQRGFFTIHGFDNRPLDEISPGLIVAIDLTQGAVDDTKQALEYSGFDEYTLFPGLEGLSRSLKKKYGID
jgi:hypothetical protein